MLLHLSLKDVDKLHIIITYLHQRKSYEIQVLYDTHKQIIGKLILLIIAS